MATVKIIYRKNKPLKNGYFPLSLRLSHLNNPSNYIRIQGLTVCKLNEWNEELSRFTKKKKNFKQLNKTLSDIEDKSDNILSSLLANNNFSYQRFKNLYLDNVVNDFVFESFESKIAELLKLKKYGNADAYTASLNALKKFTKKRNLIFSDIDYRFLTSFEHHLRLKGNAGNTISYKIRPLRALHYNYCNAVNKPLPSSYKRFKVGRLAEPATKRALNKKELKCFIDYVPTNKGERLAKDIFMFSLLTRGTNVADIALLKETNIVGDKIIYKRAKTGTVFTISITDELKSIIDKYKGEYYLFPIIKSNHKNTKYSIRLFTKYVNKKLQLIANNINIPKITTYYARYTFSSMAREIGISIELISQALGHGDLKTTEIYLNSFANDKLDDITDKILSNL